MISGNTKNPLEMLNEKKYREYSIKNLNSKYSFNSRITLLILRTINSNFFF